jgi:hypothetical protein
MKTYVHKNTCTKMFKEALLTIVKNWKKLKYPLTRERISKL